MADLQRRRAQRAIRLLETAAEDSGTSVEELLERVVKNERRLEVLEDALRQASSTAIAEKQRALSRALALGMSDDAHVDEVKLLLGLLEGIEVAHIKVLQALSRSRPGAGQLEGFEKFGGMTSESLRVELPGLADVMDLLIVNLESRGLILNTIAGTWGGVEGRSQWGLSEAGTRLLDLLR